MNEAFWKFVLTPNTSPIYLGMSEEELEAKFPSIFKLRKIDTFNEYVTEDETVEILFIEQKLAYITLNIYRATSTSVDLILDPLNLTWLKQVSDLTLYEFISDALQQEDIELLRVMADKGWIGESNEFIVVKPSHVFCCFYHEFNMRLGKVELTSPPYPNYEYDQVNSTDWIQDI